VVKNPKSAKLGRVGGELLKVPVFPLPTAILFPGIYLPLHIFEDRYKKMLKHVEDNDSLLGISYAPELDKDKFYPHKICGAGVLRPLQKFPDGRADVLVLGTKRIQIHKWSQEVPFFIGECEIIEINKDMPKKTEQQLLTEIKEMLVSWLFGTFHNSTRAIQFFQNATDLEPLCNFVSYYFVENMDERQRLLEINELEHLAQEAWKILKNTGPGEGLHQKAIIFPGTEDQENIIGLSADDDEDDDGAPGGELN